MLTLFPSLLDYAFFVPLLLRVAAGFFFLYIAYRVMITRDEIVRTKLPIITHAPMWAVWLSVIVIFVVGILLIIGMWTQAAAIVGMLFALKHGIGAKKYAAIVPLSLGTNILLFVICLSLLFSGAGAFGVDLPL